MRRYPFTLLPLLLFTALSARAQTVAPTSPPTSQPPSSPAILPENTPLRVLTTSAISTTHAREGEPLLFTLNQDVVVNNILVIPRGAMLHGIVVHSRQAGRLKGGSHLEVKLTSLDLEGRIYPLDTYHLDVDTSGKGDVTARDSIGGAEYGALGGAVYAGRTGAATTSAKLADISAGAAIGASAGALVSASSKGEPATIPAESQIDFYLALPIVVRPVSAEEAARLARRFHPTGTPALILHSDTP